MKTWGWNVHILPASWNLWSCHCDKILSKRSFTRVCHGRKQFVMMKIEAKAAGSTMGAARKYWGWLGRGNKPYYLRQWPTSSHKAQSSGWWSTTCQNCTIISAGDPSAHTWAHRAIFYPNPNTVQAHISGSVAEWGPFFLLLFSMIGKSFKRHHVCGSSSLPIAYPLLFQVT